MSIIDKLFGKKQERPDIQSILPQEIFEAGVLELKDIIAPSALKVTPKEINLGEKVLRSFFVISYPRFLSEGWFSPIINMDKVFDVSIFIHPIETAKVLRQFQKKVAEVQSQIHTREEKGLVRHFVTIFNKRRKNFLMSDFILQFTATMKENWIK